MSPEVVDDFIASELSVICADFEKRVTNLLHQQTGKLSGPSDELSTVNETFQQVDRTIFKSIQSMKWQYNQQRPVEKLANELIFEILQYCKADEPHCYLPSAFSVSTKWRNVALSSPDFWTNISLPIHPDLLPLLQKRSQYRPIHVTISNDDLWDERSQDQRIGEPLRMLLGQISHLNISWGEGGTETRSLNSLLAARVNECDLPFLEHLEIADWASDESDMAWLYTGALKNLVFEGNPASKPFIWKDWLLDLRIEWTTMSSTDIINLLTDCTQLERCSIRNDSSGSGDVQPSETVVSLPELQTLYIGSLYVAEMIHLFDHLEIPSSADVSVRTEDDRHGFFNNVIPFDEFLGPRVALYDELRIRKSYAGLSYDLSSKSRGPLSVLNGSSEKVHSLADLASYANSLSSLHFEAGTLPSLPRLVEALRSLSLITHISIHNGEKDMDMLLSALDPQEPHSEILCPRLESLDCSETKFESSRLQETLQARNSKGFPVRELKTTRGFVTPDSDGLTSLVEQHHQVDPIPVKSYFRSFMASGDGTGSAQTAT
ncbi:hypothetical protein SISSUDRAFT_1037288 [Sistotremastrum suecicum HHB10207 ss-3]|uniref:F-box domain-containing protein n=1 Tax=Sistotremastrum suecicum HHB10207 ss-3 TaxID=1314776 RepID=A0A165YC08_9AGAM|nr:hypothetical protein SISSUDRAFT_1037288 [Sistotremastrum suecicum HHB10207 ss-3]